jgi:spoIIIJ-associated protein
MDSNPEEKLKDLMKELLLKMDFEAEVEVGTSQNEFLTISILSEEAGLLIGQGGENLSAVQHIARIIASKRLGEQPINFIVDVNNYRGNRISLLKEMALSLARQVSSDNREKILEPMPSYERRIIHLALKDFNGVITESQGEGQLRRVIIKPGSDAVPRD